MNRSAASIVKLMMIGGVGFAVVSVIGFAVWALPGQWLSRHFGEIGMFAACLAAFLGSAGLLLSPLVSGPRRIVRFYRLFLPAFFAYAIVWCAAWFALRFGFGEWLGSLLGSLAFVTVLAWGFGCYRGLAAAWVVVFICHSAGYFLGGEFMRSAGRLLAGLDLSKPIIGLVAKLGWGLVYGAGFGAGIGYSFHCFGPDGTVSKPS